MNADADKMQLHVYHRRSINTVAVIALIRNASVGAIIAQPSR